MHMPCWFQILSTRECNVIFAHDFRRNAEVYIECLELVVLIWVEMVTQLEDSVFGSTALHHATQEEEGLSIECEKILSIISTLKSAYLTPH